MALSTGQKAGWGLADMGINIFVVVKQLAVVAYLTQFLGVPIQTAGILAFSILVFDVVTDPLVGWLSDRTQSRFGRRAPWMVTGALVLAGALVALFSAPVDAPQSLLLLWVGSFFALASIGFTMVAIPYGAMAGEMTQSSQERSGLTAWRMAFASVGLLLGGAALPALRGAFGYSTAVLILMPLLILAIWLSVFATRRAPRIEAAETGSFAAQVGLVLANKAFVCLVLIYGLMTLGIAIITSAVPFAALYLVDDPGTHPLSQSATGLPMESLMFAAFVIGSIISQAFWVFTSGRMGKLGALVFGLLLYMAVLTLVFSALPSGDLTDVFCIFLLVGFTNGAYQQIPWAIYPDLMDVTRARDGAAIEGAFSGIWLFGQKVANAVGPLIFTQIMGLYGWREARGERIEQSPEALGALLSVSTLVPAALLGLSILALVFVFRPAHRRAMALRAAG